MDAKEANKLSKLQKQLIKKFREAENKEVKERPKEETPDVEEPLKDIKAKKVSVTQAEKLSKLHKQLEQEFSTIHQRDIEEIRQRERKYEPITKAIKEKIVEKSPVYGIVTSTPKANRAIRFEDEDTEYYDTSSSALGLPSTPERESFRTNKSLKQIADTQRTTLGPFATRYLPRANDKQFGIYFDEEESKPKIGVVPITFENDDIILLTNPPKKLKGTEGLWRLLTKNDYFDKENMYTDEDWEAYKDILLKTGSLYHPNSGKRKSNRGRKYKGMIKKIWDEIQGIESESDEEPVGSGLANYNDNPVEYKYVNNLHDLINRLTYIQAQESAGNNNFHNEKLALAKFLGDMLEELIETPTGIKYLIRCLSVLPESMIQGSGLLNDIINNLPIELHWPGYSYLGPGTKLNKRLKRGDQGINPLDEAAKRHDIFYRDHKDTESRHVADKILQEEAWDRVISADADVNERIVGLATTGGMWIKRKLGMGLDL